MFSFLMESTVSLVEDSGAMRPSVREPAVRKKQCTYRSEAIFSSMDRLIVMINP